jgi:SAM-dependent methyltransferase
MSEARRFFDAIASRYDRVFARDSRELREHMTRVLAVLPKTPCDVLDLGVGTGAELPALLDAGHRVVGVDVSDEMLALCNKRARPIRCVRADFWQLLPLPDASFDAVIALFGSLAHAPSKEALPAIAREVARVLRDGGVFFAEVPTAEWAAAHPAFEDEKTGAKIEITAFPADAWRAALADFSVTTTEREGELEVVARLRSPRSRAAP